FDSALGGSPNIPGALGGYPGGSGGQIVPATSVDRNISMPIGIDVSHKKGNVNWAKVGSSGVYFPFIKARQGRKFKRPVFSVKWESARGGGLVGGAYHSWVPQAPGRQQAQLLIEQIGFRRRGDLPPVLDVEDDANSNFGGLVVADHETNIQEFIDTIQAE